jgi:hypothetical protein
MRVEPGRASTSSSDADALSLVIQRIEKTIRHSMQKDNHNSISRFRQAHPHYVAKLLHKELQEAVRTVSQDPHN